MIYDLSQLIFNNVPQWPKFHPTSMTVPHLTATESANVERLELMTYTGTHIDAPFHFFPDAETVDALPLSHFHAPCLALDMRHKEAGSGIVAADFEPHSSQIQAGFVILLKTGWGEKRALTKEFLTAWPYLEDICIPEAMLDGRVRHFAGFPVLIQNAGGAWARAVASDEGEMA